jgi:hypothetical protein
MKKRSSIALLLIGGWFMWIFLDNGDVCYDMGKSLFLLLLVFIYFLVFVRSAYISIATYYAFEKKQRFNYLPFLVTSILVVSTYIIDFIETSPRFDSPTIFNAYGISGEMILKRNQTFVAKFYHGGLGCSFKGSYSLNNDTLYIHKDIYVKTDGRFYTEYYMDKKDNILYPIPLYEQSKDVNEKSLKIQAPYDPVKYIDTTKPNP